MTPTPPELELALSVKSGCNSAEARIIKFRFNCRVAVHHTIVVDSEARSATPMSEHYSDERLERYAVGSLSSDESRAIDEHFLGCDRCCHRLKELAADALKDYLREQTELDGDPGK